MRLVLLVGCLASFGCDGDSFEAPNFDLFKPPYDFSIALPPIDAGDAGVPDLLSEVRD